jgi:hypothetical protein
MFTQFPRFYSRVANTNAMEGGFIPQRAQDPVVSRGKAIERLLSAHVRADRPHIGQAPATFLPVAGVHASAYGE